MIAFTVIITICLLWTALDKRISKGWYDRRGSFSFSFMCWDMPQTGDFKSFHEAWRCRQLTLAVYIFIMGVLFSIGVIPGRSQNIDFSTWKGIYTLSLIALTIGPSIAIFNSFETRFIRKILDRLIPAYLPHVNEMAIRIFLLSLGICSSIAALTYLIFNFNVNYY